MTGSRLISEIVASVRQLLHPPQFRIAPPPAEVALLEEAHRLLRELPEAPSSQETAVAQGDANEQLLARIATGLWRLRERMVDPATRQPKDEVRRAYRHLESLWDTLGEFGVEIQDHADEPFDSGMALIVLSYEHDPTASRETVKETVKPTVYLRERCIQRGEVIVASPEAG